MSKKVKSLLLVLCALVFAVAGVFATLAYLNDTTNEVDNAISVGDVKIKLDEADLAVDEYGNVTKVKDGEGNELRLDGSDLTNKGNDYNLVPGMTYPKDPIVRVVADSEPALIFVRVTNEIAGAEDKDGNTIAKQMTANGWEAVDDHADLFVFNKAGVCVDGKKYIVSTKDAAELALPVFAEFTVDADLDYEANGELPALSTFDNKHIKIKAFAVQAYGLLENDGSIKAAAIEQAHAALCAH